LNVLHTFSLCLRLSLRLAAADTEDLFDPLDQSQSLNTFTRRDHLFARLEFLLEKGGVTLFQQDPRGDPANESGVIQLEFSGTTLQFLYTYAMLCSLISVICEQRL